MQGYDNRLGQYTTAVVDIHGPSIRPEFRRTTPQPMNGADQVTKELEELNRRFAQLSSFILERRNIIQVLIQNWKRQQQVDKARLSVSTVSRYLAVITTHPSYFDLDGYFQNCPPIPPPLNPPNNVGSCLVASTLFAGFGVMVS